MASSSRFVYDLINHMRRDHIAGSKIRAGVARIGRIIQQIKEGKASRSELVDAQSEMVPMCGHNFGLLIPYYFLRYPEDKPLNLLPRPFMFAMTCLAPDSVTTLKAGRQVGKCATGDTEVQSNKGPITLRDLFEAGTPVSCPSA